jgi:hypothetical protein
MHDGCNYFAVTGLRSAEAEKLHTEIVEELQSVGALRSRLAAAVEALRPFAEDPNNHNLDDRLCHSGLCSREECGRCSRGIKAWRAIHDAEPDIKALIDAAVAAERDRWVTLAKDYADGEFAEADRKLKTWQCSDHEQKLTDHTYSLKEFNAHRAAHLLQGSHTGIHAMLRYQDAMRAEKVQVDG